MSNAIKITIGVIILVLAGIAVYAVWGMATPSDANVSNEYRDDVEAIDAALAELEQDRTTIDLGLTEDSNE